MVISDEQHYELIDRVTHEGDPELSVGPFPSVPTDVPSEWAQLLTSHDQREAIAQLWRPMADRLPRIYRALQERLWGVALLRTEDIPASLVYFFSDGDDWIPYRGHRPLSGSDLTSSSLPEEFLEFYRIHDGWVHYYSEDAGPMPSAGWSSLSTLWTAVAWKLPPGDISSEAALAVYRDGDELALAYDTSASPALPLRCRGDGTLDVLLDMWAAIDRETGVFLEELDLVANHVSIRRSRTDAQSKAAHRYEELIGRVTERHRLAAHLGGGGVHEQASDLLLNCALWERQGARQRDKIVEYYRRALQHWCTSIDLGGNVGPKRVLDWFGLAHALGDMATAHFIATLPTSIWADDSPEALQARVLLCLYLGDAEHASAFAEELVGLTVDGEDAPDPEAEITSGLLQGLCRRNASAYDEWRQRAVEVLCQSIANQRALFPWNLRLPGFDAVASRLGMKSRSSPHGVSPQTSPPDP
jgi:hypothetical protein